MKQKIYLLFYIVLFTFQVIAQSVAVPTLNARVTDLTSSLSSQQIQTLSNALEQFEQYNDKGAQLAILIVPTTGSDSIEQFATRVFDQWKLGDKEQNNGVLLLVAKNDRKVRIEVGYGLEGTVTDILAGRIIQEQIVPEFKDENYFAGIAKGTVALINLINKGEYIAQTTLQPTVEPQQIDSKNYTGTQSRVLLMPEELDQISFFTFIFSCFVSYYLLSFGHSRAIKKLESELLLQTQTNQPGTKKRKIQIKKAITRMEKKKENWWSILTLAGAINIIIVATYHYIWSKYTLENSFLLGLHSLFSAVFGIFIFWIFIAISNAIRGNGPSSGGSGSSRSGYSSSNHYSSSSSSSSSSGYSGGGGSSGGGGASGHW